MISRLQEFLQKHHKWLLGSLLFVIIVAFVFTIGAAPSFGRARKKPVLFHGYDLADTALMEGMAEGEVYSNVLRKQRIGPGKDTLFPFVIRRIVSLGLANEFKVPNPSVENLKKYIRSLPIFIGENGKFSPDLYASVLEMFKQNGKGEEFLRQILCEDYRIGKVNSMIGGGGAIFHGQVMDYVTKERTEYDFTVATVEAGEVPSEGEDQLEERAVKIYENWKKNADAPKICAISAIRFKGNDYEGMVELPSEDDLLVFFSKRKGEFKPETQLKTDRNLILGEYVRQKAGTLAFQAATDFVGELYQNNATMNGKEFARILKKFGVAKEPIPPFFDTEFPAFEGVGIGGLAAVRDLDSGRYYAEPYQAKSESIVFLFEWRKNFAESTFEETRRAIENWIKTGDRMTKFHLKLSQICDEALAAVKAKQDVAIVFKKYDLKCETYEGVSLRNFDEKCSNQEYGHIFDIKKSDWVSFHEVGKGKGLIFAITRKNFPRPVLTAEDYLELSHLLTERYRHILLVDFFENALNFLRKPR
jgi:hypothetical protein